LSRNLNASSESSPSVGFRPPPGRSTPHIAAEDANWWMITLSDLTLLLLGFLVVWYAIEKRTQPIQQPPAAIESVATQPAAVAPSVKSVQSEQWGQFKNEMENFVVDAGLSKDVSVESTQTELLISLNDTIPFASGRAELRNQALPVLEKVAELAQSHPALLLEISGHTDSVPIATGIFPSNWELSAARASRVARYLIEKGIDPSRITVQGYANQRPKQADSSPVARGENRRVELRLYRGTGPVSPEESGAPIH
jgi:chemotaxis protein MotB